MASLAQTLLNNFKNERMMAISSGNKMRLEYLEREIGKLESQIAIADKNNLADARKSFGLE